MKRIEFIVNPIAGGTDKTRFLRQLAKISIDGVDVSVRLTDGPDDAKLFAVESTADVVVAVGGDGTVNEVAKGVVGTDKVLGIIPFGSGNGLARHLGISMMKTKALDTVLNGHYTTMDCAEMNGRLFFCTCGVGLDAAVGMEFSKEEGRGLQTYLKSIFHVWKDFRAENYSLTIDGKTIDSKASMITIGNANQWGNNGFITPNASVCDGELDVAVVEPFNVFEIPLLADFLLTKRLTWSHKVHYYKGKNITIHRSNAGDAHFDGEPLNMGKDIKVNIREKSLKVIVPANSKI